LEQQSTRLAVGLESAARQAGIPAQIGRCGSMLTLFFSRQPVTDWTSAARCNTQRYGRFFWGMLDRGVYLPCSQFEAMFVSTAHTEADVDAVIAAASDSLAEAARNA
jgi:glutamate-1-semialdehyde 2,1-aminomutase